MKRGTLPEKWGGGHVPSVLLPVPTSMPLGILLQEGCQFCSNSFSFLLNKVIVGLVPTGDGMSFQVFTPV